MSHLAARAVAFWHLASFDAPTVAVVWAFAIARSAYVHLELWIAILLASGTWTVYVLDRILDARRAIDVHALTALRERHRFHWRHRRILIPLAMCAGVAALSIIAKLMPAAARQHDSIIAAAALAYFSGVHARARFPRWLCSIFSKEMLVGILFATGCAAPTLTRLNSAPKWPVILSLAFLAALAWLNCAAISNWESFNSFPEMSAVASMIALVGLVAALILAPSFAPASALFICISVSALLVVGLHRVRTSVDAVTLRAFADLVLLVPAVLLIPGVLPK